MLVVGEIEEARPWTDRDGNNRASLEVTASAVRFLDGKPQGDETVAPVQGQPATEDIPF